MKKPKRIAVVIPVFNHAQRVAGVVREACRLGWPVFVVDDGSTDRTAEILAGLTGFRLLRHPVNLGKGAALLTGFAAAAEVADWAITMDADGQHRPADAFSLIEAVAGEERPMVVGYRHGMDAEHVPWTSRFGRGFSNFWVAIAGGPRLKDSQSGFRLYPLPEVLNLGVQSRRYQFEVEVLVQARRKGFAMIEAPVNVVYQAPGERISHFRPWVDFVRNTRVFSRLICRRLFARAPGK